MWKASQYPLLPTFLAMVDSKIRDNLQCDDERVTYNFDNLTVKKKNGTVIAKIDTKGCYSVGTAYSRNQYCGKLVILGYSDHQRDLVSFLDLRWAHMRINRPSNWALIQELLDDVLAYMLDSLVRVSRRVLYF